MKCIQPIPSTEVQWSVRVEPLYKESEGAILRRKIPSASTRPCHVPMSMAWSTSFSGFPQPLRRGAVRINQYFHHLLGLPNCMFHAPSFGTGFLCTAKLNDETLPGKSATHQAKFVWRKRVCKRTPNYILQKFFNLMFAKSATVLECLQLYSA